jgi:hypothetical protein
MLVIVGSLSHREDKLWHEIQVLVAQTGDVDAWLGRGASVCSFGFPVVVQVDDEVIGRPKLSLRINKNTSRFSINISTRRKKLVRGSNVAESVVQVDDLEWAFQR